MYCKVCMEGLVIRNSLVEQDCDIFFRLCFIDALPIPQVSKHRQVGKQICPNCKYAQQWEKSHIWAIAHRWSDKQMD